VKNCVSSIQRLLNAFEDSPHRAGALRCQFSVLLEETGAGVRIDGWTISGYVSNATNARGILGGGVGYCYPSATVYITSRTGGVNVSKSF
jgi:hypothetical protein